MIRQVHRASQDKQAELDVLLDEELADTVTG